MKKSLIALAALATVGAAQAQSSVTLYGVIDAGVSTTSIGDVVGGLSKRQVQGVSDAQAATSRLGFRGNEDLGGGNSISFTLEGCINGMTGGTMGTGSTNSADNVTAAKADASSKIFNRESQVTFTNRKFGSLRLGTTDLTDAANIEVNFNFAGNSGLNTFTDIGQDLQAVTRYDSPRIMGFQVQAGHSYAGQTSGVNDLSTGNTYSYYLDYQAGKARFGLGTTTRKGAATTDDIKQVDFGASYDLGFMRVAAYQSKLKGATFSANATTGLPTITAAADSNNDYKVTRLTAAVPVKGTPVTVTLIYGTDRESGTAAKSLEADVMQAGVGYAFSKRTTGYAAYRTTDYKVNTTYGDRNTISTGIVHSF